MYGNGNTEQNREFLKDKPHREFQDLSVIYRWIVGTREDGVASVVINDGMVKDLGMTAEELFQAAVQNTKAMFPPKVTDMAEMMMSLMMPEGADPEMVAAFGGAYDGYSGEREDGAFRQRRIICSHATL